MILFQGKLLSSCYLSLFGLWLLSSVLTLIRKRATTDLVTRNRGFVGRALLVLLLTNLLAIACLRYFPRATFATTAAAVAGLVSMALGLALRTWAIVHLGRSFTVDVAVSTGQRIIDTGPYASVRHPSYTGLLLLAAGVGLCFGNAVSLVVIVVPMIALVMRRISVEEDALVQTLGDGYRAYAGRTKRLIPGIY